MKRGFFLLIAAMLFVGSAGALEIEQIEDIRYYKNIITGFGLECKERILPSELVGDTIQFEIFWYESRYDMFRYVTPDTIWIKRKKKPVEGKHYKLLTHFGGSYRFVDKKNLIIDDYTRHACFFEREEGALKFRVDSITNTNVVYAKELLSQREIYFPISELPSHFHIISNKLTRYYKQLLNKKYYVCRYPDSILKGYLSREISSIQVFINKELQTKMYLLGEIHSDEVYRTYEQYQQDSITEANYWKEFNTPHHINYYVNKEEVEYDAKYMSAFTEGYVVLLKSAQKIKVGQTIEKGKIVEEAEIVRDESFWFIGIDSICGKEYFMVGHNGKFFYVNKEDVTIDWEDELSDGTIRDYTDNTEILNVYRNLSPEAKKYYAEYMKWYVYGFYKLLVDQLNSVLRPLKSCGLIITDMSLTDGYYSTGLDFSLTNLSNKTIKYIAFTTKGFNAVDDPMETKTVRGIGPIEPGESGSYEFDHVWRTTLVEYHDPISLVITYMDGSTKKFVSKDIDKCFVDIEKVEDMKNYISKPEGMKCGILDSKTGKIEEYPKFVF